MVLRFEVVDEILKRHHIHESLGEQHCVVVLFTEHCKRSCTFCGCEFESIVRCDGLFKWELLSST